MTADNCPECTGYLRCQEHCVSCYAAMYGYCDEHAGLHIAKLVKMHAGELRERKLFERHGTLMEVKPGWNRPRVVEVLSWGERGAECNRGFVLVRCYERGSTHVYPHHQLKPVCWRCRGARSVHAPVSGKSFNCPACKYRWARDDAYPAALGAMLGRAGRYSRPPGDPSG